MAVLLTLLATYSLQLQVTRDSSDDVLLRAYRRLALKVHPDKGGLVEHAQALNAAKEEWDKARGQKKNRGGRPKAAAKAAASKRPCAAKAVEGNLAGEGHAPAPGPQGGKRVHSLGVLLTYNGVRDEAQWQRFVTHVQLRQRSWKVQYWCCTLETNKAGRLHMHLFLQFTSPVDRDSKSFAFESLVPNAACKDLLGEGFSRKQLQDSLNRGFFYCWANKKGTCRNAEGQECTAGNYAPAWTDELCTYPVKGRWVDCLWKAYKLDDGVYGSYLFLTRDSVVARKRNFDACVEAEEQLAHEAAVAARTKRIRANPTLFQPFPEVPEAKTWLAAFQEDALRYPVLVVLGKSRRWVYLGGLHPPCRLLTLGTGHTGWVPWGHRRGDTCHTPTLRCFMHHRVALE